MNDHNPLRHGGKAWNISLRDKHGITIQLDSLHYLDRDKPGGTTFAQIWIPKTYKRFYALFYARGKLEEMNNQEAVSNIPVLQSVLECLGHGAHADHQKSTAGNAGRSLMDLLNLIEITRDYCKRHKKEEPIISFW